MKRQLLPSAIINGEVSVPHLIMDCMVVGEFEEKLADTCEKVKSVWVNSYGLSDQ